jgi:hypothetical protein
VERRSTRSVQKGSSPSAGIGRSPTAARSKWLRKKSGTSLLKTTTWTSESLSSSVTISYRRSAVSAVTTLAGGLEKVIVTTFGFGRPRMTVLDVDMAVLHSDGSDMSWGTS